MSEYCVGMTNSTKACPRCDLYDCAVPTGWLLSLVAVTVANAVCAVVAVARSIPGRRMNPRGRLMRGAGGGTLPLIGMFVLAVPLFVLFTSPKRPVAPVSVSNVVVSVHAPEGEGSLAVTIRPRMTDLAGSRPFLSALSTTNRNHLCSESMTCVDLDSGAFRACPGQWSGEVLHASTHPVHDAPWFFTGDYALCGSSSGECPDDWGCAWSSPVTSSSAQGMRTVCTTAGAPSDQCRRHIFNAVSSGGAPK